MEQRLQQLIDSYQNLLDTYESQIDTRYWITCCQETTIWIVKQFIENLKNILFTYTETTNDQSNTQAS